MKIDFFVLASLVTLAAARPDVGHSSLNDLAPSGGGGGGHSTTDLCSGSDVSGGSPGPGHSNGPTGSGVVNYAPVVHKHIYVHAPPAEPDEYVAPRPVQQFARPPRIRYKIVFIKAPTAPAPAVPVLPQVPRDSEKTLIYVLVKRPEERQPVAVAPTQPSKPEVYFVKYGTRTDTVADGHPNAVPNPGYGAPDAGASLSSDNVGSHFYGPSAATPYDSPVADPSAGYASPSSVGSY